MFEKIFDDHNLFVLLIQYIDRCSQGVITRMDLLYCHLKDISVAQTFLSALFFAPHMLVYKAEKWYQLY